MPKRKGSTTPKVKESRAERLAKRRRLEVSEESPEMPGSSTAGPSQPMNVDAPQTPGAPSTEAVNRAIEELSGDINPDTISSALEEAARVAELVKYTGLDVKKMRIQLMSKALNNRTVANARNLVARAVVLGVCRGNNLAKMTLTMSEEGRNAVQEVTNVFAVRAKIDKTAVEPTVTLSRIAVCFPELTFLICNKVHPRLITAAVDEAYPFSMRNNAFASLIPSGPTYRPLYRAYVLYTCYISLQLMPSTRNRRINRQAISRQANYITIGMNQSLVPEDAKVALVTNPNYGIVIDIASQVPGSFVIGEQHKKFAPIIETMAASYNSLNAEPGDDY